MTSPKFKLRNYRFFWVSTFMWNYSTLKPLYKKNFDSKEFFVLRYTTHEFPGFCVTGHLADGQESSYVGLKHYRFWEIENKYYFNLYEFLTAKNSRISRKTQKGTQWSWRLHTKLYKFGWNVFPNISHMNYCIDLILGKAFRIFIFFHFPDSRLSVLKVSHFYFAFSLEWKPRKNPSNHWGILYKQTPKRKKINGNWFS